MHGVKSHYTVSEITKSLIQTRLLKMWVIFIFLLKTNHFKLRVNSRKSFQDWSFDIQLKKRFREGKQCCFSGISVNFIELKLF